MPKTYCIVGDGIAGATAAETIRDRDEEAEIHVFTDEPEPLYNRIMLKTYMKGSLPKQYTRMHNEKWYEKRDIQLHLETPVEEIDTDSKALRAASGGQYSYDRVLVATGGSPRELPFGDFDNLHYMWTMGDATEIKESAEEADRAVVVGGGLLGIDLAVAYAENGCETFYLIRESNWWARGLDEEGASIIHERLEEKGVTVVTEEEVSGFEAEDGEIHTVVAESGMEVEVDAVAVAIGQTPNSGLVDVEKNESGMIRVDENLQTSDPDVYAAGNMVEYESPVWNRRIFNGSWDHSEAMGRCAALNMLGDQTEFDFVNTYGVGHFDVQFLSVGMTSGEPELEQSGEDVYRRMFYCDDKLVGAVLIGDVSGQEEIKELIKNSN